MTDIETDNKRNARTSLSNNLGLMGVIVKITVAMVIMVGVVLNWIWKRL